MFDPLFSPRAPLINELLPATVAPKDYNPPNQPLNRSLRWFPSNNDATPPLPVVSPRLPYLPEKGRGQESLVQ